MADPEPPADPRLDEILARLEALERRLDAVERTGPRCSFVDEERRVVDTIVRLTTESLVREIDARMEGRHEHARGHHEHGPEPRREEHRHEDHRRPPPPPGPPRGRGGRR